MQQRAGLAVLHAADVGVRAPQLAQHAPAMARVLAGWHLLVHGAGPVPAQRSALPVDRTACKLSGHLEYRA